MNLQPADTARLSGAVPPQPESTPAEASHEASVLHGATSTGEAGRRQLSVRIGLWVDESGKVRRARWRAVDDVALRDAAEAACSLLEAGIDPLGVGVDSIRSATGATAAHVDRADLVVAAIQTAMSVAGLPA